VWGDRWQIAAQNGVSRLAARLESVTVAKSDPETVLRELLDQHWVAPTTGESEPGEPDKELDEERIRSLGPLVVSSDP
jgi:hypothetical protein